MYIPIKIRQLAVDYANKKESRYTHSRWRYFYKSFLHKYYAKSK